MAQATMSPAMEMSQSQALDFAAELAARPSRYAWSVTVRGQQGGNVTVDCIGVEEDRVVLTCTLKEWARACLSAANAAVLG